MAQSDPPPFDKFAGSTAAIASFIEYVASLPCQEAQAEICEAGDPCLACWARSLIDHGDWKPRQEEEVVDGWTLSRLGADATLSASLVVGGLTQAQIWVGSEGKTLRITRVANPPISVISRILHDLRRRR